MKNLFRFTSFLVFAPTLALAIYAPIPEVEQGKAFTVRVGGSVYYDSNIFGAADLPGPANRVIDSMVYNLSGRLAFNGSIDDQTFATAAYEISHDYIADRPTEKNLTSHNFNGRLAHTFSPDTNLELLGSYAIDKNPESLVGTAVINTDQSYKLGQLDGRFATAVGQKTGAVVKYRLMDYAYDAAGLSNQLDRTENLFGLEGNYAFLPETKLVGEYRYQTINYKHGSLPKDKDSHFLMAGFDYAPGKQLLVSARAGFEDRQRDAQPDTTSPYLQLISRYTYAEDSYLAAGYTHTIEEASDTNRFNDSKVNRLFVNVQHRLTGAISASGSLTYEPSQLQGRGTQRDVDEKVTRFGLGLNWQPTKNWLVSGTYDHDEVNSDLADREQSRDRVGVSANFTF